MLKNKRTRGTILVALVAGLLAAASTGAQAVTVQESLAIDAAVSLSASSLDCTNNPGPHVTLSGMVLLGDVATQLIFRNNVKGTHEHIETTTVDVVMELADGSITIPKQPVLGGVGGNPYIYVQFTDANGNAVSDEIFLGRCVQGLDASAAADLLVPAAATFSVDGDNCNNSPGPYITLTGEVSLSGVDAKIIFRNNVKGTHENVQESSVSIEIIPDGTTIQFAKQPVQGGVGGNPRVSIRFDTGDGWSDEIYLGRCQQDL